MAAERSFDVENIELKIDDENDDAVNIDIQQSTDQVRVLEIGTGPALANGQLPSTVAHDISSSSTGVESDYQEVINTADELSAHQPELSKANQASGDYTLSEEHDKAKQYQERDEAKQYEEWIFVDVNKSTHEIKENLLVMSSVYDGQECCAIL